MMMVGELGPRCPGWSSANFEPAITVPARSGRRVGSHTCDHPPDSRRTHHHDDSRAVAYRLPGQI